MNNIPGTITLDEDYYIDVDALNFILKQSKVTAEFTSKGEPNKNAGQHCDVTLGYFGSLEDALNHYSNELIKSGIHNSATAIYLEDIKVILEEIKTAVTKLSLTLNVKQEGKAE